MSPEGYRKCIRLMKLADRFQIPVITFVDTPGAYPGIGAEQRGQASAIAHSIETSMALTVPNPPLFELYIVWIIGCVIYTWAAWTRGSFGMLANYIALTLIDSFGLYRIIIST